MPDLRGIRSWLWNAGAFIFYAVLLIYSLSFSVDLVSKQSTEDGKPRTRKDLFGLCEFTEVQEMASPDGKKLVKLGYSDCGGTTNWQSGITVFNAATGKTYRGLFGIDGKPDGLKMQWTNDHTLALSNFPVEKLLWFNQENLSGTRIILQP